LNITLATASVRWKKLGNFEACTLTPESLKVRSSAVVVDVNVTWFQALQLLVVLHKSVKRRGLCSGVGDPGQLESKLHEHG
jgi:hypothetical protein